MENKVDWQQIVAEKEARITELETLVKFYEEQFRLVKHRQFGASSEKGTLAQQLSLFDEVENTADPDVAEPKLEQITYTRRKQVGKRADDLSALPIEVCRHKLSEEETICPDCGGSMHEMGHDSRKEVSIVPAKVKVIDHQRAVYACRNCEKTGTHVPIVKASMPKPLIKGSLASPSSVAHIMTQKYVMCAPLYRQEQDWKRQGVLLSRQTMANWVIRCAADYLLPIYERLRQVLLKREVLHADETTVQVLKEPGKSAQSKSYMWLYQTSGDTKKQIILFEYQSSRASDHPKRFLAEFTGLLHTDGYAAYHRLPQEIKVVGCWVHMRRKFEDALKAIPPSEKSTSLAGEAIRYIGKLFQLEDGYTQLTPQERYERRLKESKPLAEVFFAWLETLMVLPKTTTGSAIRYALEQRKWLMQVYLDGRTELSNNRAENSIRPFVLGRKNWLFCNTVTGADTSAVVYSIIETAKANQLNPFAYLEFLFESMRQATIEDVDSLLPWGKAIPEHCRLPINRKDNQSA